MNIYDLELGIHRRDANYYQVELRLTIPHTDAEDADKDKHASGAIAVDVSDLLALWPDKVTFGRRLGEYVLGASALRDKFGEARRKARENSCPLRLRIFIGQSAPELHSLPWETLVDPIDGVRLAVSEQVFLSRYLSSSNWQRVRLRPRSQLRALVAVANPRNLPIGLEPLDRDGELGRAVKALGSLHTTVLDHHGPVTLNALGAALREGYDVLYLVCHGQLVEGRPYLWLENERGEAAPTSDDELSACVQDLLHRPRLIVLGACNSAHSPLEGVASGIGPRLAQDGIAAVLAMQGPISLATAEHFLQTFFAELQQCNGQVDQAVSRARRALDNADDAWVPALFTRLRGGHLWYEPGFSSDRGDADDKWPALISRLRDGECTPILGPDLSEQLFGSRRDLAGEMARDFRFPLDPHDSDDLPQVAQFLSVNQDDDFVPTSLAVYLCERLQRRHSAVLSPELRAFVPRRADKRKVILTLDLMVNEVWRARNQGRPDDTFSVLARLPVPVYVTADPTNLLLTALSDAGKRPYSVVAPWQQPAGERHWPIPSVEEPIVYFLYGRLQEPRSLVLTEDAFFDYLIGVTQNKEDIPVKVRDALVKNSLLFLGFRVDDWNFRAFFRSLVAQEGRMLRLKRTHIAVQITPEDGRLLEPERARRYLRDYFSTGAAISIAVYWGGADDFVRRLHERWEEASG